MAEQKTVDWELAYERLHPVLLGAISILARRGYRIGPGEIPDLIHDFHARHWASITETFDPRKGSLEAYVRRAFLYFAAPVLQRAERNRARLSGLDPQELADSGGLDGRVRDAVVAALRQIPEEASAILRDYFWREKSERALAKRLDLTRYELHKRLITAIAAVMTHLARPDALSEEDWQVARALWRDQHTPDAAARLLGMTRQSVLTSRDRTLGYLADALRGKNARTDEHE